MENASFFHLALSYHSAAAVPRVKMTKLPAGWDFSASGRADFT
jgi:hypothetical protein